MEAYKPGDAGPGSGGDMSHYPQGRSTGSRFTSVGGKKGEGQIQTKKKFHIRKGLAATVNKKGRKKKVYILESLICYWSGKGRKQGGSGLTLSGFISRQNIHHSRLLLNKPLLLGT